MEFILSEETHELIIRNAESAAMANTDELASPWIEKLIAVLGYVVWLETNA